ncbi:CidA/LrgA family protein [Anoxybacillus tepidamans]|uniref:CidA/LrgA family protein n=1 Tax=Anoxybacteroides tepidamans TaxID=265948 RepID=UPI000552870C|nr:CidA/LrgA family protein [Anoxybacillus tepidamans]
MKRAVVVIVQVAGLYGIYLFGTWLQHLFRLPIPGSIIGMLLLFVLLMTNVVKARWLEAGGQFLLSYLSLLFVPATVGIIDYFSLFRGRGLLSVIVVALSTLAVMATSGALAQWGAQKERSASFIQKNSKGMHG